MTAAATDRPLTPEDIIVRPAHFADLGAIARFIEPFVEVGKLLPRTPAELDELIPQGFLATVEEAEPGSRGSVERIVGFAALEVYSAKLAEVRSLAVDDRLRGLGVGRRLVAACIERAESLRVLEVMAISAEEEFFRRCGFDFTLPGQKKAFFIQTRDQP